MPVKSIYHEKLAKDVVFHASCMSQRLMRVLRLDLSGNQAAAQSVICNIIPFYFLTNLTPIVNTSMQIINVIKDDGSLNQSISPFLNNVKPISIKLTAIRTYPVVFALILNLLLRTIILSTLRNSFGSKKY